MRELEIALQKIQHEIADLLGISESNLQFTYTQEQGKTRLDLITMNPRHNQSFLYHSVAGFGEMDAMQNMLDYVQSHKPGKSTYTIQWALRDSQELHTSYFRGKDIYEVLDKFYYGKDINSTLIFAISLNPIS